MKGKKLITIALQLVRDHYDNHGNFDESCIELEEWCYERGEIELAEYAMAFRRPETAFVTMDCDSVACCKIGTYECYEIAFTCNCCGHTVWVDKCLKDEVSKLHDEGVATIGCCCGHGELEPYIQVIPECVDMMLAKGYEQNQPTTINCIEYGLWCFKPKSVLKGGA